MFGASYLSGDGAHINVIWSNEGHYKNMWLVGVVSVWGIFLSFSVVGTQC